MPLGFWSLVILVIMFFTAFNYLEATMPSILSRLAPAGVKGSVMGIYSSSQFLGAFAGGVVGGGIASNFGEQSIFLVMSVLCVLWCALTLGMKPLKKSKSFSFSTSLESEEQADEVAEYLINMPGVLEATLVYQESVAYLKIDEKIADILSIKALLNPQKLKPENT
jgi:MFS family permease